jgi:hypothetical protein
MRLENVYSKFEYAFPFMLCRLIGWTLRTSRSYVLGVAHCNWPYHGNGRGLSRHVEWSPSARSAVRLSPSRTFAGSCVRWGPHFVVGGGFVQNGELLPHNKMNFLFYFSTCFLSATQYILGNRICFLPVFTTVVGHTRCTSPVPPTSRNIIAISFRIGACRSTKF